MNTKLAFSTCTLLSAFLLSPSVLAASPERDIAPADPASIVAATGTFRPKVTISIPNECPEARVCATVRWASYATGDAEHARSVRVTALVDGHWQTLASADRSGPVASTTQRVRLVLSDKSAEAYQKAKEILLTATQRDAAPDGSHPQVHMATQRLMTREWGALGGDVDTEVTPGADLANADLGGAGLAGADLSNVNLDDADLSGADLRGANLTGTTLGRADLSDALLTGATWVTGQTCQPPSKGTCTLPTGYNYSKGTVVTIQNQTTFNFDCLTGIYIRARDHVQDPLNFVLSAGSSGVVAGKGINAEPMDLYYSCNSHRNSYSLIAQNPSLAKGWIAVYQNGNRHELRTSKTGDKMAFNDNGDEVTVTRTGTDGNKNVTWTFNIKSVPGVPTALAATDMGGGNVQLNWQPPEQRNVWPWFYGVQVSTDGGGSWQTLTERIDADKPTTFTVTGLPMEKTAWFRVAARNGIGWGAWTGPVSVLVLPADISQWLKVVVAGDGIEPVAINLTHGTVVGPAAFQDFRKYYVFWVRPTPGDPLIAGRVDVAHFIWPGYVEFSYARDSGPNPPTWTGQSKTPWHGGYLSYSFEPAGETKAAIATWGQF